MKPLTNATPPKEVEEWAILSPAKKLSGVVHFKVPGAGKWELRLIKGDGSEVTSTALEFRPSIDIEKTILKPNEILSVKIAADPTWPKDAFIVIVPSDTTRENSKENYAKRLNYFKIDQKYYVEVNVEAPAKKGSYSIRVYSDAPSSSKSSEILVKNFEVK